MSSICQCQLNTGWNRRKTLKEREREKRREERTFKQMPRGKQFGKKKKTVSPGKRENWKARREQLWERENKNGRTDGRTDGRSFEAPTSAKCLKHNSNKGDSKEISNTHNNCLTKKKRRTNSNAVTCVCVNTNLKHYLLFVYMYSNKRFLLNVNFFCTPLFKVLNFFMAETYQSIKGHKTDMKIEYYF